MPRLSAYLASVRKFCLDHPAIVTGACAALGLLLTGRTNEAIATMTAVLVGRANAPLARGVAAACQK